MYIYRTDDQFLQLKPIMICSDQSGQLKVNYNTLTSVMTTKGQLQHVMISSDN